MCHATHHPPDTSALVSGSGLDGIGIEIIPGFRLLASFAIPRHPPPGWTSQQQQQLQQPKHPQGQGAQSAASADYCDDNPQDQTQDIDIGMKGWSDTDSDCEWDADDRCFKRRRVVLAVDSDTATSSNDKQPVVTPTLKTKPKLRNKKMQNNAQSSKDADDDNTTQRTANQTCDIAMTPGGRLSGLTLEEQIQKGYGRRLSEQFYDIDYSSMR